MSPEKSVSPVLSLEPLLELLLTQDSVLPPQSLLKGRLSLQSLLVAEHRVIILAQHLIENRRENEKYVHIPANRRVNM